MLIKEIDFSFPKKIDILILDDEISKLNFRNHSQKIIKKNEINIFCFLKTVLTYFFEKDYGFKRLYKLNLYRMFSPTIAISHDMNNKGQECKRLCPEIIVIIYQFSYFHNYINKKKRISNNDLNYYLIWNRNDKNFVKNISKNKIIVTGSIRNNSIILKKRKKIHKLTLISEFSPTKNLEKKNIWNIIFRKSLRIVDNFCVKNKMNLFIALRSKRKDKNFDENTEKQFYKKFLKCKHSFNDNYNNSYEVGAASNLIINFHSTTGHELLSRKFKIFFLPLHERFMKKTNNLDKRDNFHIHRKTNEKEIFKKISNLLKMSDRDWNKKITKKEYLSEFDSNNKKLMKIVGEILNKNKNDKKKH